MIWLVLVLRVLHVSGGVFWVGSLLTVSFFVLPTAALEGPDGQRFLRRLALERGLTPAMLTAAGVTVLAGLSLMAIDSGGFQPGWFRSGFGVAISVGALAAFWALGVGIHSAVLARRLGGIAQAAQAAGGPPSAEQVAQLKAIGQRLRRNGRTGSLHGLIAVACMAAARYLFFQF